MALLLSVLLIQTPDVRALIEKFKSDDITVREDAFKKLKELGDAAEAELEKAAKDSHAEVSSRAKKLLHLLRTRRELTPNLRALVPGIEERLAFGDGHAWTEALNELLALEDARWFKLKRADLNVLAARAWEFARPEEREDLRHHIEAFRLRAAVPAIIKTLEVIETHEAESLLDTFHSQDAAIPRVVELLKHPESSVRAQAVDLLDRLEAYDSHPFVMPLLHDRDNDVREGAVLFFREAKRPEAAPELRKLLTDPDEDVRSYSLEALRPLASEEVFARLLKVKEESNSGLRSNMVRLLGYYRSKEAAPPVIELLKDASANVREAALDVLGRWKRPEWFELVLPLLADDDDDVRESAAEALIEFDRDRALPEVRKLLDHSKPEFKKTAVEALSQYKDATSIPAFKGLLSHENVELKRASLTALVNLRASGCTGAVAARFEVAEAAEFYFCSWALTQLKGPEAVPALLRTLESPDSWRVERVLRMLASLKVAEASPRMVKLLTHESPKVRAQAAIALAELGERSAIPGILKLLKDEDDKVRGEAIEALGDLKATEAREDILPFLKEREGSDDEHLVHSALYALGRMKDKKSVPDVLPFLEQVRFSDTAFSALCEINDPSTYPAMTRALDDLYHENRMSAARAFGRLKAVAVVPALLALLKDEEPDLRACAVEALGRMATPEAMQGVFSALDDPYWECRDRALHALRQNKATASIPRVAKLLRDPKEEVRLLAADTLGWLGSRDGARASLEGRLRLTGLSFLRRPEAARKLESVRMKGPFEGTNAEFLDRIAKAGGTPWKASPAATPKLADWLIEPDGWLEEDDDKNLMEILDDLVDRWRFAIVVEADAIVVTTRDEAVALFEAWLAESK